MVLMWCTSPMMIGCTSRMMVRYDRKVVNLLLFRFVVGSGIELCWVLVRDGPILVPRGSVVLQESILKFLYKIQYLANLC